MVRLNINSKAIFYGLFIYVFLSFFFFFLQWAEVSGQIGKLRELDQKLTSFAAAEAIVLSTLRYKTMNAIFTFIKCAVSSYIVARMAKVSSFFNSIVFAIIAIFLTTLLSYHQNATYLFQHLTEFFLLTGYIFTVCAIFGYIGFVVTKKKLKSNPLLNADRKQAV